MEKHTLFILLVIFLAYLFEFINGFHDAANSIATIVATKVLTPRQAVIWAAFFNFIAFLIFELSVANTLGTGLINPSVVSPYLIFSALISAIAWNLFTWYYGLPSSSSHALIGGLVGSALARGGSDVLNFLGLAKVVVAIVLSPLLGLFIGLGLLLLLNRLTHRYQETTKLHYFKYVQLISSAMLSISHGGNDAQKTMGVIAVLLYSASWLGGTFYVPFWVVTSCYLVISLGTLAGGWRIVDTMGNKITDLNTLRGCCAETGAAIMIFTATHLGIPVSTTHTVTGSITGVGLTQGVSQVGWSMIRKIFIAWLLTIPATTLIAFVIMFIIPG